MATRPPRTRLVRDGLRALKIAESDGSQAYIEAFMVSNQIMHLLRMPENRLVKEAIKVQFHSKLPGNIFMDAPPELSYSQLVELAKDRKRWKLGLPALAQKSTLDEQREHEEFERQYKLEQQVNAQG